MKKFTSLFTFLLFISFLSFSQTELLSNGNFENWDNDTTPTGWSKVENIEKESTEIHDGSFGVKHTGGTKDLGQYVGGITPGNSYTISLWYKVIESDGSDARIWSYWKNGAENLDANADELRGPANGYLDNNGGVWMQYTAEIVAPAEADTFYFEVRTYSGAVTYWDSFSFIDNGAVSVESEPSNHVTGFSADEGTVTETSVDLAWTENDGEIAPTGYLIMASTESINPPADGATFTDDIDLTDGMGNVSILHGTSSYTFDNCLQATTYNISIFPYNGEGNSINYKTDDVPSITVTTDGSVVLPIEVSTIAEIRAGAIDGTEYKFTGEALVTMQQSYRNQKYIQDETAAILIDDNDENLTTEFTIGDAITEITGSISEYNGVLQFIPTMDATKIETPTILVEPQLLTIQELKTNFESYESELVKVDSVIFDASGTFDTGKNYDISKDGESTVVRTNFYSADYISEVIPEKATIIGIAAEFRGTAQIFPRSGNDIQEISEPVIGPQIGEATISPESPSEAAVVEVSAEISTNSQLTKSVILWGTASDDLSNEENMTTSNGLLYSGNIPAQDAGTEVFFKISATDFEDQTSTSDIYSYTVVEAGDAEVILSEHFEGNLGDFNAISVLGDQEWYASSYSDYTFAKISAFSDGCVENEDWLISPALPLNNYSGISLSFINAQKYGMTEQLEVLISTNYDGTDVMAADWIAPEGINISEGDFEWVASSVSLDNFKSENTYIAFKFTGNEQSCPTWEIDSVFVTGIPLVETIAQPIITPSAGTFYETVPIAITTATEGASIYYTLNGDVPTDASTLYAEPFELTESATVKAVAIKDGKSSIVSTNEYSINIQPSTEVSTISELKAGNSDGTIYLLIGDAVVTWVQEYKSRKHVQDETGAIFIDDPDGIITTSFEIGDGITQLKGTLDSYNGLTEFNPVDDADKVTGINIDPQVVAINELKSNFEDYESEIIQVKGVQFTTDGTFENGNNYNITNGTDTMVFRTNFYDVDYIDSEIPSALLNITGIAIEYKGTAQIASRNASEIETANSVSNIDAGIKIYAYNNRISVESTNTNSGEISVYSLSGNQILSKKINSTKTDIEVHYRGIVLVTYKNQNGFVKTSKLILNSK